MDIDTPIQYVPRIGPVMADHLGKLGINTARDLLWHAPFRYNDFSVRSPIAGIRPGQSVSIIGTVVSFKNVFTKNGKKLQEAQIADSSGSVTVIWFNQLFLSRVIVPGETISMSGTVGFFGNRKVLQSPDYEIVHEGQPLLSTGRIVPVYPETRGVSSKWLRGRIAHLLEELSPSLSDPLPERVRGDHALLPLNTALRQLHFPDTLMSAEKARSRLAFDELLFMHIKSMTQRSAWQETRRAPELSSAQEDRDAFASKLPFRLTSDQTTAYKDIAEDLARPYAMNRLLIGDVGSGKTVVAAGAITVAAKNGYQSVLMAPTQILAEQHYETLRSILKPYGLTVALITSKTDTEVRAKDRVDVVVGTHALLTDRMRLKKPGLVVIDEQQRFGVKQRAFLQSMENRGIWPHLLSMSATPIPRTLALTLYGNLDVSRLDTLPSGRKAIKTWVVPKEKRDKAYAWIRETLGNTRSQAFIVCPFIEESESMTTVKAATKEFAQLSRDVFPDMKLGLLHGKQKPAEKARVLEQFRSGAWDILVTTPVVEVGIDIPSATVMMIEASDRFGLSQLHQLRGRVGRGEKQSYCLLFTENDDEKTVGRLRVLETVNSGPVIADIDFSMRGPGDMFGTRQHGVPALALASLTDEKLVAETRQTAKRLLRDSPDLSLFPLLRERLNQDTIRDIAQD